MSLTLLALLVGCSDDPAATPTDTVDGTDSVEPTDPVDTGPANAAPSAPSISLGPEPADTTVDLIATVVTESVDTDGDPITYTWSWTVDDQTSTASDSPLLPASATSKGQTWRATATPTDGLVDGEPATTNAVQVVNSPPTGLDVTLLPEAPTAGTDDLICEITSTATDLDDDSVTVTLSWLVDGQPWTGVLSRTWLPGDTVPASVVAKGETWTCIATPHDGEESGAPATDEVALPAGFTGWPEPTTTAADQAAVAFLGDFERAYSGQHSRFVGDVDGDGREDMIFGAYGNGNTNEPGQAFLITASGSDPLSGDNALSDAADVVLSGEDEGSYFGTYAQGAGDLDGDGLDDVLVPAWKADDGGEGAGAVYVYLAATLAGGGELMGSQADAAVLGAQADENFGRYVAGGADVDGDGLAELLVGSDAEHDYDGGAWLLQGSTLLDSPDSADAAWTFRGESGDKYRLGFNVENLGDVDGDGVDDIGLGAPYDDAGGDMAGKLYVYLGASLGSGGALDVEDADHVVRGSGDRQYCGFEAAGGEDVDGDGTDDVLFGGYYDYPDWENRVWLVLGSTVTGDDEVALDQADATFASEMRRNSYSPDVAFAGDVDGDGRADLMMADMGMTSGGGSQSGRVYLFLNADLGSLGAMDMADASYRFDGDSPSDLLGMSLSAGDANGDGYDDLLLGGTGDATNGAYSGKTLLLLTP